MADRVIFHVDCNAFYASVEELLHPELRTSPMAVCGNPESRRGIILAKNELAKGFGVKTAETIWQAKQKCPDLVLRPARHHLYREYCERVNAVYEQYTDQVERFGIDESYLDVTGSLQLFGSSQELANRIREHVPSATGGLTVSVGVSWNKAFAKLASDLKKPNAVSYITRENCCEVAWPLPVSALLMVGHVTEETLHSMYIRTIGDLAAASESLLRQRLGKLGEQLHIYACGLDDSPVLHIGECDPLHSVGNGMTFKRNLVTPEDIRTAVISLSDVVAGRMRRHGVKCMTVQLTIKDTNLKVITRQKAPASPTFLAADIAKTSMELVESSWRVGVPIRMLTITGQKLIPADEASEQLSLFGGDRSADRDKRERLEKAVDRIRGKFGSRSISPGSVVRNDLGINDDYGKDES